MIKTIFKNILANGETYDVDEIESWFALERSWVEKSTIERVINIAHYQQTKFDANNKIKFISDNCSCGK